MNITEREMMAQTSDFGLQGPARVGSRLKPVIAGPSVEEVESPLSTQPATPLSTPLGPAAQARFRSMIDAHFAVVWRYLGGLGVPPANVDDAAQQVFLVAAAKILSIEPGLERSFLLGTAHGVAANARRSNERRREVHGDAALATQADHAPDPEQNVGSREAAEILDAFLASLPEELRTVFMLFELEGMTMASIAESLHIPPGTVASRLRRAREDFHEMAKRVQAGSPSVRGRGGRS
jgi:RNA polymerase sigma-70 factor, ECF subfamily